MKKSTESKEDLVPDDQDVEERGENEDAEAYEATHDLSCGIDTILTTVEKKFLLCAERGDCATVRR